MTTEEPRALANEDQDKHSLMAELTAYVRENINPEARRVTKAVPLIHEPLDTSRRPHRTWFQVDYE